jgi:hypothetical protein
MHSTASSDEEYFSSAGDDRDTRHASRATRPPTTLGRATRTSARTGMKQQRGIGRGECRIRSCARRDAPRNRLWRACIRDARVRAGHASQGHDRCAGCARADRAALIAYGDYAGAMFWGRRGPAAGATRGGGGGGWLLGRIWRTRHLALIPKDHPPDTTTAPAAARVRRVRAHTASTSAPRQSPADGHGVRAVTVRRTVRSDSDDSRGQAVFSSAQLLYDVSTPTATSAYRGPQYWDGILAWTTLVVS